MFERIGRYVRERYGALKTMTEPVSAPGGDQRFWLFAIIAVAGAQILIQWGYSALSVTQGGQWSNAIAPYIGGYNVTAQKLYHTWLLPFLVVPLAMVLVAGKYTRRGQEVLYWSALCLTAAIASSFSLFVKYPGAFGQPAYVVASVLLPVLAALVWFARRNPSLRFADAVAAKSLSVAHFSMMLIAIMLGVSISNDMGSFLALGYNVSAVAFLLPLLVVTYIRPRLPAYKAYTRDVMSWLACVCAAFAAFPIGNAFEAFLYAKVGISPDQTAEAATPMVLGALLAALIWLWRPRTPWQSIASVLLAAARATCIWAVAYRRALLGCGVVMLGLATVYYGNTVVLPLKSPQEAAYNSGMNSLRNDLARQSDWSKFVHPEQDLFQQSLQYFEHQRDAGLLDRLLYGEPDVVLASQANLKIGVILLYNAKDDTKLLNEAKGYLELAVQLNPGVPYAADLLAHIGTGAGDINRLALMALAPERDLEMLYAKNPQYRSKKPNKSKDGKGKDGQEQGDQQGQPDQPNEDPGKPSDKQPDKEGMSSTNQTLQQNMQDVNGGKGNDGI